MVTRSSQQRYSGKTLDINITKKMIGLIARSDNTGLGIQTHEFYKHIKPDKTLIVNVSRLNNLPQYHYRYPKAKIVTDQMSIQEMNNFLDGLKVLFCCETPYNNELFRIARRKGVKIVLQYNYEFLDFKNLKDVYYPDVFAAPSLWNIDQVKKQFKNVTYLPVPVNRQLLPFIEKKKFKRFLHIVGNSAAEDRNGTKATLEAFRRLNRPYIELVVKCFNKVAAGEWLKYANKNISIDTSNTLNYEHNYVGFDALILPRKYGGLCLPMQEALSCGMPVIMTNISPNDKILPLQWLVPCQPTHTFESKYTIQVNEPDIEFLIQQIQWFANMNEEEAIEQSQKANEIASGLDWSIWKQKYMDLLITPEIVFETRDDHKPLVSI